MRDKTPPSVFAKQIDLLYQSLPPALLASALIPILFLIFLRDFPDPEAIRTWTGLMLLVILFRALTAIHYQKTKKSDSFQIKQAETLFIAGVVLGALIWGSLSWWIYPLTDKQSTHFLFFISVLGIAGGSVASLAYRRITGDIFIILILSPMLIGMHRSPGKSDTAISIIVVIYIFYLLKIIRFFQESSESVLLLKEKALAREAKLKIASKKAEAANRAKSRFLANMSHEIRTPMNSIIGQTRLAIAEEHDPKIQLHLDIIKNSSKNLLSLINDILDFSKIEAGELRIDNRPFNLHVALQSILETIRVLAEDKKGLQLTYNIAPDVPHAVIGDILRLRQIMLNLLNNGIKFTDKGHIDLSVTRVETMVGSLLLQFEVRDTGIGIAFEKQEIIFDEFAQEDDSLTRQYGGTGLGLAICKQLCQLMGGDIEVTSVPGEGSNFTCTIPFLPCQERNLPVEASPNKKKQIHHSHLSLLLVEDNEANRILARMVLEGEKHHLMEAHDGLQALNILSKHTFDAILMDVQMPVMDGYAATKIIRLAEQGKPIHGVNKQLAAKLKKHLYTSHTPIIAMTANAMNGDKEKCLAAGMDDYLAKPFHPDGLSVIFSNMNLSSSFKK
jgi:signal transduction histidine kinase/AmiR/NasT family two-component response regulator